jgi:hypothetical protein
MFARTLAALLAAASMVFAVGCAPAGEEPESQESDVVSNDEALDVAFEVIDARRDGADWGLTVIKSKQAYVDFFGSQPPSSVKFNKHWVLHYSLGVQGTGGYGTEVTSVERAGSGNDRKLVVTTRDTFPGPGCAVTQALTNPQVAVRINKHNGTPVEQVSDVETTDCSEPDYCHKVRCANGYECDETQDACVPRACNPESENDCGPNMVCMNQIRCITTPCPEDFRCVDPCGGITYDGTCNGDSSSVLWCDEGEILEYTCEAGTSCSVDDNGWYDCL